ncbi:MAG TPA: porphobilinogen synthase [Chthonomonadales bacterium]|nr:porphobilinogen synthase [Chthonomonadales bacterium]
MLDLPVRLRRMRRTDSFRRLMRETTVQLDDLVQPVFITEAPLGGEIASMPGIRRHTLDGVRREAERLARLGIRAVMLFGIPATKDEQGSGAFSESGVIPKATKALREEVGDGLIIACDVCLCEYTSHGHCGVFRGDDVDNDASVELLCRSALVFAQSGADIVAPSDMMDGRVGAIRRALDAAGRTNTAIMAYSAKFASAYYGPFRDAAECAPQFGDRSSYQMDPANAREAMREMELDAAEGADILMVKPGLAYLDIVCRARGQFNLPLAIYNVSGEYSMVKAAAANGWIDEDRVVTETLTAFKRAGADLIITYHAADYAGSLRRESA